MQSRIVCQNAKCGIVVEFPIGKSETILKDGRCQSCGSKMFPTDSHVELDKILEVIAGHQNVKVEVALPMED